MDKFLTFGITGITLAAIYAVIASGLVLTYTTTGIFNFAHGAAGMFAAFTYWQLRFDWGWPAPIALLVVLLVLAPLFGVVLERVVMRGLHDTSETVRLVVTIALLSAMIAAARWIWDPNVARPMPRFFASSSPVDIGPTSVTVHQLITIAAAVVVAVTLRLLLHRSRLGIAMRAAVDDRSLSVLNGADPHRSGQAAWALGTSLAALGGVLIAPNVALDAGTLALLIVSAYAAAIFGRLRSLPLTFLGAVVVGCTESFLTGYLPTNQYLPGLRLAAPALILLLVLLLIPNPRLKGRVRSREEFPMPSWRGALLFAGAAMAVAVVLATTLAPSDMVTYARMFPIAIIALSFVLLIGFAGQISLAQLSLAGIGGLVAAHHGASGNPLAIAAAAVVAGAVGALIAFPALRLSGIYLALGTAAFAMVLDRWIFTLPDFSVFGLVDIALFDQGSVDVAPLAVFGYAFDTPARQMVLSAGVFALLSLAIVGVRRGMLGRRLLAVKDSEAACATLGGGILGTKVFVFGASAAIAGIGGALYSMQLQAIHSGYFDLVTSLPILVLAVIGGIATVGGALFVGLAFTGLLPALVTLWPTVNHLAAVLPGLAGVALGRNPNGIVHDLRSSARPLGQTPLAWGPGAAVFVVAYGLRLAGVLDNWPFAVAVVVAFAIGPVVLAVTRSKAPTDGPGEVPVEWRGLVRPWTAADRLELDAVLGLPRSEVHGTARS